MEVGASSNTYSFKIVLLGEGAVGKTSLVLRYVEGRFNESHISTVQAAFLTKKLNVDGDRVKLAIWDTAGQEKFHALGPIYYRDSDGALLVYDITDEQSFQRVQTWVKELRKVVGADICLCIAGNKSDLEKDRHVSQEEAETYASSVGAKLFQTSAKLNRGIDEMFLALTRHMLAQTKAASVNGSKTQKKTSGLQVVADDPADSQRRSRCC